MKLCKDCRWISRTTTERLFGVWVGAKCTNPAIGKEPIRTDPTTGKPEGGEWAYCSINRMHSSDDCGYDGKLWEPQK